MQKNPKAIFNFISLAIHSKIHCSVILFCTRLLLNKANKVFFMVNQFHLKYSKLTIAVQKIHGHCYYLFLERQIAMKLNRNRFDLQLTKLYITFR